MDRKTFLIKTCLVSGVGISGLMTLLESCRKSGASTDPQGPTVNFTLDLSQPTSNNLNTIGGSLVTNGVVVANSGGNFIAVAQQCTHNGCSINYNKSGNDFVCPCHGGTYDVNGNVTAGPPPSPIKKYSVIKNGSILTISG